MKTFRQAIAARTLLLSSALVGFVLATFMAVSPEFHHRLHEHAGETHHECLATVIDASGCDCVAPGLVAAIFQAVYFDAAPTLTPEWVEPIFLNGSVRERAPPIIA